ncbi:MAG TPA: exodeoxyribonuclease V subunit beta [Polyangiaceae bacterium]|jgi:exodeoxyribonuclease V beta subunit|nr:exodeoxyribonuclease V subunit beta [Polyangiaceae bacterium]
MTPLDPFAVALTGVQLIEASAGTGKTHTITTLFVRLVVERKLPVDRILVVTFTNAATAELRDRIRKRLREASAAFATGTASDPALRQLVARSTHRAADMKRLETALASVDEAAVHTIHAFCQRVLAEHAFEGGVRPDLELIADIRPMVTELVHDFVSREFATAPRAAVEYARSGRLRVSELVQLGLLGARLPDAPVVADDAPFDMLGPLEDYFVARRNLAAAWPASRDTVTSLLFESAALNRNTYSQAICARAVEAVETLLAAPEESLLGYGEHLVKLSAACLARGAKAGRVPPKHMLFTLAERLVETRSVVDEGLGRWVQGVERRLVEHVRRALPKRAREHALQSFDDVLTSFRDALRGRRGRALASAVRRKFPAALIDEFHDTDPVQYEIFRTLYRARGTSLFLIGDPKQAIYAFRGADIFAYLSAAADADARFTLGTNHRSDPTYVKAVNAVMSSVPSPFLLEQIRFEPVATPAGAEDRLRRNDAPFSGMDIVFSPRTPSEGWKRPLSPAMDSVPALAAGEIARMLDRDARVTLRDKAGFRPLEPGDFAVLTRSNVEAGNVQRALRALGVPSVLHGDSSVLDTDEAGELSLLLAALADPSSTVAVRSALATSFLGLDAAELVRLGEDEAGWEKWANDFASWHAIWKNRGFLQAMRRLMRERRTSARLLRTVGGERKLTNFLHLIEICHREAMDRHLGVAGLSSFFGEVRHDDEARDTLASESQQIRLESDERAVQLTTMHRSKGLEYPVVVLPYLFRSANLWDSEKRRLRYHDPAKNHELLLDLRPLEQKAEPLALAEEETMAEGLRLAYVALTRAKHRSIVFWGAYYKWYESALARLFHPEGSTLGDDRESMDDERMLGDLHALAERSGGSVSVRLATADRAPRFSPRNPPTTDLTARLARRRVTAAWRTSSFSALSQGDPTADVERDLDPKEPEAVIEPPAPAEPPVPLDEFPRGPRAGDVLHAILEDTDFERRDPLELRRLVGHHLSRRGFDRERWEEPLTAAFGDVLETPFSRTDASLRLGTVTRARCLPEMEFTLSAGTVHKGTRRQASFTAESIADVLASRTRAALPAGYAESVRALGFAPLSGYLRGFIDLVFEHGGRYFVVDYKSNHLGGTPSSYVPRALVKPMAEHHYYLQYHLYLVALHRHLRAKLPGYAYAKHMGGAYYLFLRGMSRERGPETGIFHDLPEERAIEGLSRALDGTRRAS